MSWHLLAQPAVQSHQPREAVTSEQMRVTHLRITHQATIAAVTHRGLDLCGAHSDISLALGLPNLTQLARFGHLCNDVISS